jgi:hypothetical protein
MNDMVSIRKIRPGADELSSIQAVEAACEAFGEATERLLGTSFSAAARVLAIDDLERGDNRSSLAARTGALDARVVAKDQVIAGGLIDGVEYVERLPKRIRAEPQGLKPGLSIVSCGAPEGAPFQNGFGLCGLFPEHDTRY